jgi:hypothetical protein
MGYPQAPPNHAVEHVGPMLQYPQAQPHMYPAGATTDVTASAGSRKWIVWVVALLVLGAGAGAVLALVMK